MIIFPLSTPGKIVLILVAIALGLIWSQLQFPGWWRKFFKKNEQPQQPIEQKKKK